MQTPDNTIFKIRTQNLIPATFKKAIISSLNLQNLSASVFLVGNSQTVLTNIPFAASVDITTIQPGDKCRIDCFSENNPSDMVIAYIYSKPYKKKFSAGNFNVGTGGNTIPHGLGVIPDVVGVTLRANGTVWEYQNADATNIYLKSASGTISTDWYTIKF